ncbi:MAG: TRAP transporter fused permease subunit [Chloroflexi bacterium]|nr:TRAP transporter fused permease subunit [Chloroflexota bacterium]
MNRGQVITVLAGITGLYEVLIASRALTWLGIYFPRVQHRAISLALVFLIIFLAYSARGKERERATLAWYDVLLVIAGLIGAGFMAVFYDLALEYSSYGYLDTLGMALALLLIVPLLEAVRRSSSWILPLLIITLMAMTMFQNYLPGLLHGKGFALDRLTYGIYVGTGGIFGLPLGVSTSILIVFLLYASLLQTAGVGEWFMGIALALTGSARGGPAKAAVISSAFFGTISGSPAGNTATTGAFTIPLMIKTGYRPTVAGAVEAVSSTGGQLLPPVMGAVAFVMAEWINVGYADIVKAALIPAVLYYVVVFASVHFEALRHGIRPSPRGDIPAAASVLKEGWFYLIPLGALVYFLIFVRLPPDIAGMFSLPFLIGSSFLSRNRKHWLLPRPIFYGVAAATKSWVGIVVITAAVGMLVGSLELSGLAVRIPGFLLEVSGQNLALTLAFVGLSSLVLGMGLDSIPAYMTLAALAAPTLITLGLSPTTAHLFVVYWGMASFITPPVCIAVFVACGLSGAKVWATGWEAVKLGIAAYVIPFAFAFDQSLLMEGPVDRIVVSGITALAGSIIVAAGLRGYMLRRLGLIQRSAAVAAGFMLIAPSVPLAFSGVGLIAILVAWQLRTPVVAVPDPGREVTPTVR